MKIGILTFIHTHNYGANLQCLALQTFIMSLGHDVEVIDMYRPVDKGYDPCKEDRRLFPPLHRNNSFKDYQARINKYVASIIKKVRRRYTSEKPKKGGFLAFQEEYIHFSEEKFSNINQLYKEFPQGKYDVVFTGSDQVWNYDSAYSKEPFFLTFVEKSKKVAYAASLGHDSVPDKVSVIYSKWLNTFSAISVREDTAVTALSKITKKEIVQTLDPTLLLSKTEWAGLLSLESDQSQSCDDNGYILVYMLSVSTSVMKTAIKIADALKCSLKIITNRPLLFKGEYELLQGLNPRSFVQYYSKARFIVTNSFHGTAFAINFNIPFVTVEKEGARLNARKTSLLKLFNLEKRKVYEGDDVDIDSILDCDFTEVNAILAAERAKSIQFLKSSLEYAESYGI